MVEPGANCHLAIALYADQYGEAGSDGPVIYRSHRSVAVESVRQPVHRSRLVRVPAELGRNKPKVKKAGAGGIAGGSTRQQYHPCLPKVQKKTVREA